MTIPFSYSRALPAFLASLLMAAAGPAASQAPPGPPSRGALTPGSYAITHVNVVPMTSERITPDATVLVRDGRITAIGRNVAVPAGTREIDGRGKYLVPGLADMHTHLYSDGAVPDSAAPAELGVMVANGITAIRLMIGTPEHLALRRAVESGAVLGPQLWVASPHFTTEASENARVVTTPDSVRAAVRDVAAGGYDFVKVTFGITGPLYEALVGEAKRVGIRVVGHVEPAVGVRRAIAAGQQIEHLDAYLEGALADSAPMQTSLTQFGVYRTENWKSLDYIDDAKLTALARETARAGIWTVPTLEIFNRAFSDPLSDAELCALPDWNMIPNRIRGPYVRSRAKYWAAPVPREQRLRYATLRNSLLRRIAEAGGPIMSGSDSPDLLMAYGFALHRELAHMVRAGLTPYQALATATRNPAIFLGAEKEWGTIAPGRRADLVLLAGNPLQDIRNTERIEGVSVGGRWLPKGELAAMIAAGTRAIDGAAPARSPDSAGSCVES
jgi:imidazolonepropionase-like amidohydrolase